MDRWRRLLHAAGMDSSTRHSWAVRSGLGLSALSLGIALSAISVWARTQFTFAGSPPPIPDGDRVLATALAVAAPICWISSIVVASSIARRPLLWPAFAGPVLGVLLGVSSLYLLHL